MSGDRYIIFDQNAIYFLTFPIVGWIDVLTRKEYKQEIVNSLNYCVDEKGLIVYAWCIMSNHAIELESHMMQGRLGYIYENPLSSMIVAETEHYIFSSARDYAEIRGLVEVELIS